MPLYEYKLVPAPDRARKIKGLKGVGRFAATVEEIMNELGAEGWRYLRTDALPQEERVGLTGKQMLLRHMLVFERDLSAPEAPAKPDEPPLTRTVKTPTPPAPAPAATPDTPAAEESADGDAPNIFSPTVAEAEGPDEPPVDRTER